MYDKCHSLDFYNDIDDVFNEGKCFKSGSFADKLQNIAISCESRPRLLRHNHKPASLSN